MATREKLALSSNVITESVIHQIEAPQQQQKANKQPLSGLGSSLSKNKRVYSSDDAVRRAAA